MSKDKKEGNWFSKHKILSVIMAVFVIGILASALGDGDNDTQTVSSDTPAGEQVVTEEVAEEKPEDNIPAEYKSALAKANSYANTMHMLKAGVFDQLTSEYGEKFSQEAGQYAIDNVTADWNKNALQKAKDYQETMHMSPDAIRDQLVSEYGEKFTAEEADYALAHLSD